MSKNNYISKRPVLILVAALLIIVASIVTVLVVKSTKTPRDLWFDAERRNFSKYSGQFDNYYNIMVEKDKARQAERYRTRVELTADISSRDKKPFGIDNPTGIFDIIGKCKVVADTNRDAVAGTSATELSLLLEKNPLLGADIYTADVKADGPGGSKLGSRLYFDIPFLSPDRYFSFERDKLEQVYERFALPVRPVRLPTLNESLKALHYDKGEVDSSAITIGTMVSGFIGEKDVAFGEKVQVEIRGQKIQGQQIFVTIGEKDAAALVKGLAEEVFKDEKLMALTYGNLASFSDLAADAGLFQLLEYLEKAGGLVFSGDEKEMIKTAEFKEDLESFMASILKELETVEFPDGIEMTVVIDGQGSILDRRINAAMKDREEGDEADVNVHTAFMSSEIEGVNDGRLEISWSGTADGIMNSNSITVDLDSGIDSASNKRMDTIKYNLAWGNTTEGGQEAISGQITSLSWKNDKLRTENRNTEISIKMKLPSFGVDDTDISLKLAGEDRLGIDPFSIPALDSKKNTDIYTATDEELGRVERELMASLGVFYLTNKPVMDAFITK